MFPHSIQRLAAARQPLGSLQMTQRLAHVQRGKQPRTAYLRRRQAENERHQRHQQQQQQQQQPLQYSLPIAPSGNVLTESSPAAHILSQSSLRVTRQLEMLNILLSYEQANRYALMDSQSNPVGFMLEHRTFAHELMRQAFRLHRPFKVDIVDLNGHLVMRAERKFSLVNSRVTISDHSGKVIGESQQEWHLWRRRYDLFTETAAGSERQQFARVDAPFLSWDFPMVDQSGEVMAGVFRDFAGIGMELFSDYGLYAICFDKLALAQRYQSEAVSPQMADRDLNLDERAAVLAAAISIDFDYFSRHSRMGGGGFGFFPFFGGGSNELTDSQDIDIDT